MNHQILHYPSGWQWHILRRIDRPDNSAALKQELPQLAGWIDDSTARANNHIDIQYDTPLGTILSGTLLIQLSEHTDAKQQLHFHLSKEQLITLHSDMSLPIRMQSPQYHSLLQGCNNALEAMSILLTVILDSFHPGLDRFEQRLTQLEVSMQTQNQARLIDQIMTCRYELLQWHHLFIPVDELHNAAKEAYMQEIEYAEPYKRVSHKLERIATLIAQYSSEIDSLISMDDAISSLRGNDIMKTLTMFTVLFTPATVAGALWGVNFIELPFKDQPWGFALMNAVILALTFIIYFWLWRRGWTGDLLRSSSRFRRRRAGKHKKRRSTAPHRDEASLNITSRGKAVLHSLQASETAATRSEPHSSRSDASVTGYGRRKLDVRASSSDSNYNQGTSGSSTHEVSQPLSRTRTKKGEPLRS